MTMLNLKHLKEQAKPASFETLSLYNSYRTCFPTEKRMLNNYFMGRLTTSVQYLCSVFCPWLFTNTNGNKQSRLKSPSDLKLENVENQLLGICYLKQIHDSVNVLAKISVHPISQQFRSDAVKQGNVFTSDQY